MDTFFIPMWKGGGSGKQRHISCTQAPFPTPHSICTMSLAALSAIAVQTEASLKRPRSTADSSSQTDTSLTDAKRGKHDSHDDAAKPKHRSIQSIAAHFYCPITQSLMVQPAIALGDGCMYERAAIAEWLRRQRTSPVTRAFMVTDMLTQECPGVKSAISDLIDSGELEHDVCIEWHIARAKVSNDDACAARHFQRAVDLGCQESARLLELQAAGIKLRDEVAKFRQQATDASLEMTWVQRLLRVDFPSDAPDNDDAAGETEAGVPRGQHHEFRMGSEAGLIRRTGRFPRSRSHGHGRYAPPPHFRE